jgi:hypothetical protein
VSCVGDPSPLNPVRVESGSRGESLRIMADKPARPLGFGQSRRATPATRASAPVLRPGALLCPIATRPRPAPPHPNLTRYSPNLRGDALQQSSHKSPVFKMKHFSQTVNRRADYPRLRRSARPLGGVGASVPCVSASPWADKGSQRDVERASQRLAAKIPSGMGLRSLHLRPCKS